MAVLGGLGNNRAMVKDGGTAKKKKNEELNPVTPVADVQGAKPITQPVKGNYMTNSMAMPTYSSPTASAQYGYGQAAPTWQWDDSVRPGDWQWDEERPAYNSQYQNQINQMVNNILNREAFSYDYNQDPLYAQYREAYTRNGTQAMNDTLAQMAARTGGLASSYAGTAAQQAYNGYMDALNDKIPELYRLAYSMYQDEGNRMRNNLDMIQGLESTDYGRYMDALGQWNTDRNFSYGQYQDDWDRYYNDRNFSYGQYSDDWDRWNTNRNWDYNLWQDNLSRQEAAAKAAYNSQVAAYNANQQRVNDYNAKVDADYDKAMAAYNQKVNNSYDSNPNATIKAVRNSGSSPVVEFYGVTYNLSQNGNNGLSGLIARINNMPFSAAKREQLMNEINKLKSGT